jgi:hypothetical protein
MRDAGAPWGAVAELTARAGRTSDLRAHGLHLIAAARLREAGDAVPAELILEERRAAVATLAAPALLQRARAAYDGSLMVMKGPEVALRYPDTTLRPFKDVDLLADDAEAAQRALIAAGFQEVGPPHWYEGIHHLRPLGWPGLPIAIEVHSEPKWAEGLTSPPLEELFDAAEPSGLGIDGLLAPAPHHHALLLAAHAWAHEPLRRLIDLVDVAAMTRETHAATTRKAARHWGCERVWRTTELAVDALFYGSRRPLALRTWARHLHDARERTVLDVRLQRLGAPAWGLSGRRAPQAVLRAVAGHLRRYDGESWRTKVERTSSIVRGAARPRSEHDRQLGNQQEGTG